MSRHLNQTLWPQVEYAFDKIAAASEPDRARFLEDLQQDQPELYRWVHSLLLHHQAESRFDLPSPNEKTEPLPAGSKIDPYRIERIIGSGGMGDVYLAVQEEPFLRQVALKLLRPGLINPFFINTFHSEQQALASMNHPAVATIHDAGITATGLSYLVMAYVDGDPLLSYCDRHRLTIRRRLRLFHGVCEGVRHAHGRGIIHRDIKPSNVLVEDGEKPVPKIIDFGIAKTLGVEDDSNQRIIAGTPAYMAPEQRRGEAIDKRTDVYALGILLYQLMSGTYPFRQGPAPPDRASDPQIPPLPSSRLSKDIATLRSTSIRALRSNLAAEINWVVLKAMEPEPANRYETVDRFMADIEAVLDGRIPSVRPPSFWQRAKNTIRRNRFAIAVTGITLFTLTLGLIGTSRGMTRAQASRQEMEAGFKFLQEMLMAPSPLNQGKDLRVSDLVEYGEEKLLTEYEHRPKLKALLLVTFGKLLRERGNLEKADKHLQAGLSLQREIYPRTSKIVRETERLRAGLHIDLGRFKEAKALLDSVDQREQHLPMDHPERLETQFVLTYLYSFQRKRMDHLEFYEAVAARFEKRYGMDHLNTLSVKMMLTECRIAEGRLDEAMEIIEKVRIHQKKLLKEKHPDLIYTKKMRAIILTKMGAYSEAETELAACVQDCLAVFGEDHPYTLMAMDNWQDSLLELKQYDQALALRLKIGTALEKIYPRDHPEMQIHWGKVAILYGKMGRFADALALAESQWKQTVAAHGEANRISIAAGRTYAHALVDSKQWEQAEKIYGKTIAASKKGLGADHHTTVRTLLDLRRLLKDQKRFQEATHISQRLLQRSLAKEKHDEGEIANAYFRLTMDYFHREEFSTALLFAELAQDAAQADPKSQPWRAPLYRAWSGRCLSAKGNPTQATHAMTIAVGEMQIHAEQFPRLFQKVATFACELSSL